MELLRLLKNVAAPIIPTEGTDIPTTDSTDLLTNILNIIWFVMGIVAVIMIIIGGYQFLTSNGDPGKAAKARNTILYAVIGLVVALSAFAITNFVIGNV